MRKLEEYLKKHSSIYTESASTYSKYFEMENCKIRMSDHLALESDADLHILTPINQSEKYIVLGNENTTCYLWGTNEIIEFIPYFIKMCNLRKRKLKTNTDFMIEKVASNLARKKGNPTYINKILSHSKTSWEPNDIVVLKDILEQDLGIKVTELPKAYVEYLRNNDITYSKALNLYKTLYIDNKFDNIDATLIIKILNSL